MSTESGKGKRKRGAPRLTAKKRPAKRAKLSHEAPAPAPAAIGCDNCRLSGCPGREAVKCVHFVCYEPDCESSAFRLAVELDKHLYEKHHGLAVCMRCSTYGAASLDCTTCRSPLQIGSWRQSVTKKRDQPAVAGEFKGLGGGPGDFENYTVSPFVANRGESYVPVSAGFKPTDGAECYICACPTDGGPDCKRCHPGGFPCHAIGGGGGKCALEFDSNEDRLAHYINRHDQKLCPVCKKDVIMKEGEACTNCTLRRWQCSQCKSYNPANTTQCSRKCKPPVCVFLGDGCKNNAIRDHYPFCKEHDDKFLFCHACKKATPKSTPGLACIHCEGCFFCPESVKTGVECKRACFDSREARWEHLSRDHGYSVACPVDECKAVFPGKEELFQHAQSLRLTHGGFRWCAECRRCLGDADHLEEGGDDDDAKADYVESADGRVFCLDPCAKACKCTIDGCDAITAKRHYAAKVDHYKVAHGYSMCFVCKNEPVAPDAKDPFKTPLCSKCAELPLDSTDRALKCPFAAFADCSLAFKSASDYFVHLYDIHTWITCETCRTVVHGDVYAGHEHLKRRPVSIVCDKILSDGKRTCDVLCASDEEYTDHLVDSHDWKRCYVDTCFGSVSVFPPDRFLGHVSSVHRRQLCKGPCTGALSAPDALLCTPCLKTNWCCPTCKTVTKRPEAKAWALTRDLQCCPVCKKGWCCPTQGCEARVFDSFEALIAHLWAGDADHKMKVCESCKASVGYDTVCSQCTTKSAGAGAGAGSGSSSAV